MECNIDKNMQNCTCTYDCSKKGKCCECIEYHRRYNELPGCLFPKDAEKTYNRTVKYFCDIMKQNNYRLS